ncbi:MAG: germination protein YpeB [Clostridia bacterium]|nr:germination protein YpeB [Clostridia bacterium]
MMFRRKQWLGLGAGIFIFLLSVSVVLAKEHKQSLLYLENQNRRSFTELTESVRNIDVALSKAVLSREPAILNQLSHEITANAAFAKSSLGQLPVTDINLDKTQKYLAQVGDYTVYLAEKTQRNQPVTEADVKTMLSLLGYADHLSNTLLSLEETYFGGNTTFSDMISMTQKASAAEDNPDNQFTVLEQKFGNYPRLIYDGAFSDHLDNRQAEYLVDKPEISKKEAQEAARNFLGTERVKSIKCIGESQNTIPVSYSFTGKLADDTDYSIDITKQGGEVLYYLNNRENHTANLSVEDAMEKGLAFLKSIGRGNVTASYYEIGDGFLTLNYCPLNGDIREYPDLMKLRISLDNGEILAYEAKGYLLNHRKREVPEFMPFHPEEHIDSSIQISSVNRALIPTDDGREIYAYELKGKLNNRDYLVYINAETGNTEQILLVIENENGVLTE